MAWRIDQNQSVWLNQLVWMRYIAGESRGVFAFIPNGEDYKDGYLIVDRKEDNHVHSLIFDVWKEEREEG